MVDGGGIDELVAPVVVGPEPVLDGCPVVDDKEGVVPVAMYRKDTFQ